MSIVAASTASSVCTYLCVDCWIGLDMSNDGAFPTLCDGMSAFLRRTRIARTKTPPYEEATSLKRKPPWALGCPVR